MVREIIQRCKTQKFMLKAMHVRLALFYEYFIWWIPVEGQANVCGISKDQLVKVTNLN